LLDSLSRYVDVRNFGDVSFAAPTPRRDPESGIIAPQTFVEMVLSVGEAVTRALRESCFPLVLGGDCGLLLGCLDAVRGLHGQPGLLFVDGHEDAYAPHESPTGETADMEIGLALGRFLDHVPLPLRQRLPLLTPADVVMLGPRDASILQKELVPSLASLVEIIDDAALLGGDLISATNDGLKTIGADRRAWWLHTDLDVLSTDALPAVDYQQPGGLSWEALEAITLQAIRTPNLCGWDITIYNPDFDPDGRWAARIVRYITRVIAHRASSQT
jgi:arginase